MTNERHLWSRRRTDLLVVVDVKPLQNNATAKTPERGGRGYETATIH